MSNRRFMLDTDTVSFVFRGEGGVGDKLTEHAPSEICVSAITLSELRFGAEKRRAKRLHKLIDSFIATVDVLPFDAAAATMFGRVCAALGAKGAPIGVLDTLIAAHSLCLGLTLVTNNTKHFKQVQGLKIQNWFNDAG